MEVTWEQALALLQKYNQEPFHILHALTVEGVMRWYAQQEGEDADFWGLCGLLHDVDFERYPEQHASKRRSCWPRSTPARRWFTPSALTATACAATWSRPTKWKRFSLLPTS